MKYCLVKSAIVLASLTLLLTPVWAQKGKPGGGGGSGGGSTCAVVATPILSTSSASHGTSVGVFSRVGNCSSGKKRFTVTVTATDSCNQETVIASSVIAFDAGQYKLISVTYAVAPDTCSGSSTIRVSAFSGDTLLSTDSAPLTIQ